MVLLNSFRIREYRRLVLRSGVDSSQFLPENLLIRNKGIDFPGLLIFGASYLSIALISVEHRA